MIHTAFGYDGSVRIKADLNHNNFDRGLSVMTKQVNSFGATLKKLASTVALAFGTAAIINFGKEAVKAASALNDAWMGLESIVAGQGKSFSKAKAFINDYISDGLVPLENAVTAYKNLSLRGYSTEQIEKTLVALKNAAAFGRQASYSMGEAISTATEGLKNENSILVDNAGVTKNVSVMWKEYAESIGVGVNSLTKAQKIQAEVRHSVDGSLYETFGIGNAMSATLTAELYAVEIPKGAVIKRYVRLTNGRQYSEWLPKGVFFTNRRTNRDGYWTIEAYDAMLKADITWTPRNGFTFPCTMEAAAQDIALSMGVALDERNVYLPYTMQAYPEGEYMRRDALRDIAAAHGGNFIMSDAGKLRLVPLLSFPAETSYLVSEYGDAITFGGVRILV